MHKVSSRVPQRSRSRSKRSIKKRPEKLGRHQLISKPEVVFEEPEVYAPENAFNEMPLTGKLKHTIQHKGYMQPTEIQDQAILPILEGRDIVGIAGTGTGKTAAFLIPIIQHLSTAPQWNKALIVAPTRELANQITEEFNSLVSQPRLFAATLIGGVGVGKSVQALSRKVNVVIATPGRLMDMYNRGLVNLEAFETLVLDEFDRMLDMGFLPDVKRITFHMHNRKQTLLFSATMNKDQEQLVENLTHDPVRIKAGKDTHHTQAIHQDILEVPENSSRKQVLVDFLNQNPEGSVLLFCETKRKVRNLCRDLTKEGVKADMMHGDMSQSAREKSLDKFRKKRIRVLVATNVAARGIDVDDIGMVINYEVPTNYNEYVHRIGRTGRAGKTGRAITIM